jgi:nucleotide-binding universal stress UspA family protein
MKILVGVDGSDQAFEATRLAAKIGGALNAKLILANVAVGSLAEDVYKLFSEEMRQQEQAASEGVLLQATKVAGKLEVEKLVLHGKPAEALAEAATSRGVDLVVVGSRGQGSVKRMLLGSVSDRLIHICEKPVLVVR